MRYSRRNRQSGIARDSGYRSLFRSRTGMVE
jgi:hypothetical protein